MFRVITQNSVYLVAPVTDGFNVRRVADMWGRAVKRSHSHYTRRLSVEVGGHMETDQITTTKVQAVTSAVQTKK